MKVLFISLGCDKNLVDSEVMLGLLSRHGYEFTDDEEEAEAVVINTCCFISDAKEESVNTILDMAERRKNGQLQALLVTGCLAQRYSEEMQVEIPEVDAVLGTTAIDAIADALDEVLKGQQHNYIEDINKAPQGGRHRVVTTGGYYAYLKIAEGCDNHCTYCVIPSIRGRYKSRRLEDIVSEAERLAGDGVRELVVIAQDTTAYGKDIYGKYRLPELLKKLCAINGVDWIRVHYCYPELVSDELIEVFKTEPKLCSYFDIPIQHSSDKILKKMGRHTNKAQIVGLIEKIRHEIPDAVIRTSLIVGFPGETEEDFEDLCDFVRKIRFERLGVFAYSREEDTPAYSFDNQIDEEEKERRRDLIMMIQSEIAEEQNTEKIGSVVRVLVEDRDEIIKSYYGRTYADSEEIDGKVFFKSDRKLNPGEFVNVKVEQAMEYDLFGAECDACE